MTQHQGQRRAIASRALPAALPLAAFGLLNAVGALLAGQATGTLLALDGGLVSLAALFVVGGLARRRWLRVALLGPALALTLLLFRLPGNVVTVTYIRGGLNPFTSYNPFGGLPDNYFFLPLVTHYPFGPIPSYLEGSGREQSLIDIIQSGVR